MGAIQQILRRHAPAYLARFGQAMPAVQRTVIEAICSCRSEAAGSVIFQCERCGEPHVAARCCGNRHCPGCQQGKAEQWLARQLARQLPCPHFMLTFTVPEALREFMRTHPRQAYAALFDASSGAIKRLAADARHLGAQPGFFGVQHVLPTGFIKVRYFGFLSPSCAMPIEQVRARIEMASGFALRAPEQDSAAPAPAMKCLHCGGRLRFRSALLPRPMGSRGLIEPPAVQQAAPSVGACASG